MEHASMNSKKDITIFDDNNPRIGLRLNERLKRIVDANKDAFDGKTLIDLAANNGRWSYAAVAAGAKHVHSIEWRQERIDDALGYFKTLGVSDKISTNQGDMFRWLDNFQGDVDTVLCLGVYYHIMDHYMLLRKMAAVDPTVIIIDSGFVRSFRNSVHIQLEDPSAHLNTSGVFEGQTVELVGFVSLGLLIQMSWNLGYSCKPVVWNPKTIPDPSVVQDYMMGRRYTVRLDKMDGNRDSNWAGAWREALVTLNPKFELLMDKKTHDLMVDTRAKDGLGSSEYSIF